MRRALAALPLLFAACASASAERDPLAGRVAGEPVNCIGINQSTSLQVVDQKTILYREGGRRLWRTGPKGACPALGRVQATLIIDLYAGQLCRNDRFRVLEIGSSIPSAFCFFDQFTPYDLPPKS